MGAQLVSRAFLAVARDQMPMTPNARLLLLWMALSAIDSDAHPVYFRKPEDSAQALGHMIVDHIDEDVPDSDMLRRQRESALRMVRRATTELVERGYIKRRKRGQKWQRAEYELTIPSLLSAELSVPPEKELSVPLNGTISTSQQGPSVPPKEPQEPQEPDGGSISAQARTLRAPVETRGAA